ncbi:hypothetical protein [Acidovorax sp.]|uniref:hypothetical protein n=1 Tax=Acidovorax sp. TaxID=1872122 RepID=UPI004037DD01
MKNYKSSRYQYLSQDQVDALRNHDASVEQHHAMNSFIGNPKHKASFDLAWNNIKALVSGWKSESYWKYAFLEYCNAAERASSRTAQTVYSNFRNGFFCFWTATNREHCDITSIDTAVINEYINWTRTGEYIREDGKRVDNKTLSENTRYRRYQLVQKFIEIISKSKLSNTQKLTLNIRFPKNPYAFRHMRTEKTEPINDDDFLKLLDAAQREVLAVMTSTRETWRLLERGYVPPDYSTEGRGRYRNIQSAVWEVFQISKEGLLPNFRTLHKINPALYDAINRFHGGYKTICRPFEPSSSDLYPFLLIFGIYTSANTGPLRALNLEDTTIQTVMGQERLCITLNKNRSSPYQKSFPLDPGDPLSPQSIYEFIVRWTKGIRAHSGELKDHLFLYKSITGKVSNFLHAEQNGRDSDSSWKHHTHQFCKKYGLAHFSNRMIRETGLDIVREKSGDSMRSIQAISGNKSAAVIRRHYDGASAKNRGNENLAHGMLIQERYVFSDGTIDPRGSTIHEDISSATPGWSCLDPFSSPYPENTQGRLCQSYGFCPKCPKAALRINSPYVLARVLQLTKELEDAREYLSIPRWNLAYEPVLERLQNFWLPLFNESSVRTHAGNIKLTPLARVE